LGAGVVVGLAAVITFVSAWLGRRQDRRHFMSSQAMERQRDFLDRYTTAATQLGNENSSAIRLAGVYALVGLADEWLNFGSKRDGQMAIDLLRSYLRVKKPTTDYDEQEREVRRTILLEFASRSNWYGHATDHLRTVADEPSLAKRDIQVALDRLRRQRTPKSALEWLRRIRSFTVLYRDLLIAIVDPGLLGKRYVPKMFTHSPWQDMNTDLPGRYLAEMRLTGTQLRLAGISLSGIPLIGADLSRADLRSADLEVADLSNTILANANLVDVYARSAILEFVDLRKADLRYANLGLTNLGNANLAGANLLGAKLTNASVSGANFTGAKLDGGVVDYLKDRGAILDDPDWEVRQHAHYPHIWALAHHQTPTSLDKQLSQRADNRPALDE
jgi:uncharacterized protein YjbI with pentapeptide repeats